MRRDHLSEALVVTNHPLCDHTPQRLREDPLPAAASRHAAGGLRERR
ncbi:hypothetical protein [Micromonospora wenchangensis]